MHTRTELPGFLTTTYANQEDFCHSLVEKCQEIMLKFYLLVVGD